MSSSTRPSLATDPISHGLLHRSPRQSRVLLEASVMAATIQSLKARQIFDSRGNPTVDERKMSGVVATLGWSRSWPEQLLQCFFVAAKCVRLLHLLAFSFGPPLTILRVEGGRAFDQVYMEDILQDRQQVQSPCQVKIMVMPGFYVQDRVLKCRVLTTRSEA